MLLRNTPAHLSPMISKYHRDCSNFLATAASWLAKNAKKSDTYVEKASLRHADGYAPKARAERLKMSAKAYVPGRASNR